MSVSRGCSRDAPARKGEAAGQAWTQPYWERMSLISPLELLFIFVKGGFVLRSLCAKKEGIWREWVIRDSCCMCVDRLMGLEGGRMNYSRIEYNVVVFMCPSVCLFRRRRVCVFVQMFFLIFGSVCLYVCAFMISYLSVYLCDCVCLHACGLRPTRLTFTIQDALVPGQSGYNRESDSECT